MSILAVKHDYLRIFGNKSLFDFIFFGSILFLLAFVPSLIFNEKQTSVFLIGTYLSLYVYLRLVIYFSNYEEFRSVSGGKWEYSKDYQFWRKLGYFEALESQEQEAVEIIHPENAIENN